MMIVGPLSLNTLTFNLLHWADCFHIFDSVTKTLAQNDLEWLGRSYVSVLQDPGVCIYFWASERKLTCKRFIIFVSFIFILIKYVL